ncbi:glycosyltransferase family 4 protein [Variovorax sp. J22R24]|uniref:glycosyltransferase family 4 protein n=1 Tax=Variovorax gracilis TaxID=3053502 RepID=UPI002576B837|nr:glycosyltransferase family 4 protein [Variovorax sp. J22R24]MDM0103693.1 glycosyltransferase family 4 protein [Variovorax sp. J22R24]
MNLLVLTKYGRLGASSRMRSWQYVPWLQRAAIKVTALALIPDEVLQNRYRRGGYGLGAMLRSYGRRVIVMFRRGSFDAVWIEKEAMPWMPLWLERVLLRGVPYVLDYDDAIFHNYDCHRSRVVRHVFGKRLDGLMAGAALVIGGNSYLAQRAEDAGAPWVEVLPTTIDLARYPRPTDMLDNDGQVNASVDERVRIVWIGSPSTVRYLQLIREPLQALAARRPFALRVIGGGDVDLPGVDVEVLPWSEETEVEDIIACDVGVMPLEDSPWERGKCAYKLIQYMACGLPVVASPVGVNTSIVGRDCGFLAKSSEEWLAALESLLSAPALRRTLGQAGRRKVEEEFCIQVTAPRLASLLRQVGAK